MTEENASGAATERPDSAPSSPNSKVADPEALALAVRNQVEYYFSKENLQTDTFLISKMDSQKSVPIEIVMGFSKLKALTEDQDVVIEALKGSSLVMLADGRIKSIMKSGRSTIILREIPSDTAEEAVREIFAFPECKPIVSIRSEIGDTWFVAMESEEDAKDTLLDLKLKKRTFNGTSVKARLKTETVIRSYYPAPAPMAGYPMMSGYSSYGAVPGAADPSMPFSGYNSDAVGRGQHGRQARDKGSATEGNGDKSPGSRGTGDAGPGSPRRDGVRRGNNGNNSSGKSGSRDRDRKSGDRQGGKSHGRDKKEGGEGSGRPIAPPPSIEINSSADFPPLPGENAAGAPTPPASQSALHTTFSAAAATFTPAVAQIPQVGYPGSFVKYSVDDIMHIVKNIQEAKLPETIQAAEHGFAMTVTPNTDLLLRQRTFSIDETREQMQQGRPVQREAVIAGDVDYGSLFYGEDTAAAGSAQHQKKSSSGSAGGGSWAAALMKGGDAPPPAPTPQKKPETAKSAAAAGGGSSTGSSDKKGGAASSSSGGAEGGGKKKDGKREDGNRKGEKREKGAPRERRNRSDSKGTDGTPAPSSWGGRPTFANVLKEAEAAEAAKQNGLSSPPTPNAAPVSKSTSPSKPQSSTAGRAGTAPKERGERKPSTAPDGNWGKEKLPPLQGGA